MGKQRHLVREAGRIPKPDQPLAIVLEREGFEHPQPGPHHARLLLTHAPLAAVPAPAASRPG